MKENFILEVAAYLELYNVHIKIYRDVNQKVSALEAIGARLRVINC